MVIKASGLYANGADPYYARNVAGAVAHNLPIHVFHFLYCLTETAARRDARLFYETVRAQNVEPIAWVLDCEAEWGIEYDRARPVAEAFEAELRRLAGDDIRVAIYIAHGRYREYALDYAHYDYVWIPRYGKNDGTIEGSIKPDFPCDIWQYTSHGRLPGINGDVDMDVLMGTKPLSYFTTKKPKKEGDTVATNYKKYILSTGTHYISNSGGDENGGIKGGQAGDQNGKEWCLKKWFNRPWSAILRWPDQNIGTLIAQLGIDAALNNKIGYDQGQRNTYWTQLKKVGYYPAKITTPCEEDCTAGVNANVHAAGYLLGIPSIKDIPETGVRSSNMKKLYKAAGFKVLTDSKYLTSGDYLLPGDILLYVNHHGATNITVGKRVKDDYTYHDVIADPSAYKPSPTPTPEPAKLGDRVLKYGDEGEDIRILQTDLMQLGYALPKYGADGDFGSETEKAVRHFQQEHQLPEDGVMDDEDYTALFAALEGEKTVEITGGSVNVRSAPGTEGTKVLGTVHKGDVLPYQGQTQAVSGRDWYLIEYKNQNGWVSGKYGRLVE